MIRTCPTNGGLQNTSPCHTVRDEGIPEETRMAKDKLEGHCETQPEGDPGRKPRNWRQIGQNGVNGWPSASNKMRDEQNRTMNW